MWAPDLEGSQEVQHAGQVGPDLPQQLAHWKVCLEARGQRVAVHPKYTLLPRGRGGSRSSDTTKGVVGRTRDEGVGLRD